MEKSHFRRFLGKINGKTDLRRYLGKNKQENQIFDAFWDETPPNITFSMPFRRDIMKNHIFDAFLTKKTNFHKFSHFPRQRREAPCSPEGPLRLPQYYRPRIGHT